MRDLSVSVVPALTYSSIILVHGLKGHPVGTWESNQEASDKRIAGPSHLRQSVKSVFKSKAFPLDNGSTKDNTSSAQRKVFWPKDYLAQDIEQARV